MKTICSAPSSCRSVGGWFKTSASEVLSINEKKRIKTLLLLEQDSWLHWREKKEFPLSVCPFCDLSLVNITSPNSLVWFDHWLSDVGQNTLPLLQAEPYKHIKHWQCFLSAHTNNPSSASDACFRKDLHFHSFCTEKTSSVHSFWSLRLTHTPASVSMSWSCDDCDELSSTYKSCCCTLYISAVVEYRILLIFHQSINHLKIPPPCKKISSSGNQTAMWSF